jgi:hypothetical protein
MLALACGSVDPSAHGHRPAVNEVSRIPSLCGRSAGRCSSRRAGRRSGRPRPPRVPLGNPARRARPRIYAPPGPPIGPCERRAYPCCIRPVENAVQVQVSRWGNSLGLHPKDIAKQAGCVRMRVGLKPKGDRIVCARAAICAVPSSWRPRSNRGAFGTDKGREIVGESMPYLPGGVSLDRFPTDPRVGPRTKRSAPGAWLPGEVSRATEPQSCVQLPANSSLQDERGFCADRAACFGEVLTGVRSDRRSGQFVMPEQFLQLCWLM